MATAAEAAPLDEVMLAMDVVDTLRHRQDLVGRELDAPSREAQLINKLREIYRQQGIDVPDHILKQGVEALDQSRFAYTPPAPGFGTSLARLYVSRKRWSRPVLAGALVILLGLGGYFLAYKPYQAAQIDAARVELAEALPAQMDALYRSIFEDTKVQSATTDADAMRRRGKAAAAEGDRAGALKAIADMTALRDRLRQEYTLTVVNRQGEKSGIWTTPDSNTDATNYYLVVEALDPERKPLTLPILNEENGQVESVPLWGIRVPDEVYRAVASDKQDDGIIEQNVVGIKQYGFLDVDYVMPVLGGAVTRW